MVLFLTDGLPTVGQTSEKAIREIVVKGNPHERRVFTFGVGVGVNTPLLDRIAMDTRAASTFVLPTEDVEVKVGQLFKRLSGPVLAGPKIEARAADGAVATRRVRDLLPSKLPDLFEDDQLILLGQYHGEEPLEFALTGDQAGEARTFKFGFTLDQSTTKNAFVPRLWASRQIAVLAEAIRDLGADPALAAPANDPRLRELVNEIVSLSKEFGILTEYTAFLALEGTDLTKPANVLAEAQKNYDERAVKTRWGFGAVNQSLNFQEQRAQSVLKNRNDYWDENLQRVEITTVQQVNDRAFYKRGGRWVDSSLVDKSDAKPQHVVEVGSPEFNRLVQHLAAQSRQGTISLGGEILMQVDGETILVR